MLQEPAFTDLIRSALAEDIGNGDHSTLACIPAEARGGARLKIKEDGVLAGMEVAEAVFHRLDASSVFKPFKKDGDSMKAGEVAFEVEASVHTLLMGERLVLNCMQRMSGIATLTRQYVDILKGYHTRLLDTRIRYLARRNVVPRLDILRVHDARQTQPVPVASKSVRGHSPASP